MWSNFFCMELELQLLCGAAAVEVCVCVCVCEHTKLNLIYLPWFPTLLPLCRLSCFMGCFQDLLKKTQDVPG